MDSYFELKTSVICDTTLNFLFRHKSTGIPTAVTLAKIAAPGWKKLKHVGVTCMSGIDPLGADNNPCVLLALSSFEVC